jgi:UDP-N-acetylglucosamine 1-carboxyvinyltransferase
VTLEFDRVDDLAQPLRKLAQTGVDVEVADGVIQVRRDPGSPLRGEDVSTWVHPGFPSDLQAQYLALMTQAAGPSLIQEWLYENRFQHVPELVRMGADIQVRERSALVRGPSRLRGTSVGVTDIRSGAALLIAALCAEGTSELHDAWHLGRGYEDLVGKLARLGARLELRGRDA